MSHDLHSLGVSASTLGPRDTLDSTLSTFQALAILTLAALASYFRAGFVAFTSGDVQQFIFRVVLSMYKFPTSYTLIILCLTNPTTTSPAKREAPIVDSITVCYPQQYHWTRSWNLRQWSIFIVRIPNHKGNFPLLHQSGNCPFEKNHPGYVPTTLQRHSVCHRLCFRTESWL
jgi:hypothetical protein